MIKSVTDGIVYTGHMMAANAVAISIITAIVIGQPINFLFLIIAYSMIYSIYLNDYGSYHGIDSRSNKERSKYVSEIGHITTKVFLSASISMAVLVFTGSIGSVLFGVCVLVPGLLYGDIFKPMTKHIPMFKNVFVAFVWSLLPWFYVVYCGSEYSWAVLALSVLIFLRMGFIQIFFDCRDVDSDELQGLKTLPVMITESRMLSILKVSNLVTGCFMIPYGMYYLRKLEKKDMDCHMFAAAEPIIWMVVFVVLF